MKHPRRLLLLPALLAFSLSAVAQTADPIELHIQLKGLQKGDRLYLIRPEDNRTDTLVATRKHRADLTLTVPKTQEGFLYYLPKGKTPEDLLESEVRSLCLQPGDRLTVKGHLSALGKAKVGGDLYEGHPYRDYFRTLDAIFAEACVYSDSLHTLLKEVQALPESTQGSLADSLRGKIRRLNDQSWAVVERSYRTMESFVRHYPQDPFSAYVLTCIRGSKFEKTRQELFDLLSPEAKDTPAGREMEEYFATNRAWKQADSLITEGAQAPEFTLTGIDGQKVSLSDFRGKYLVLDFWGSWCGPCREANPYLRALYERYKDRSDFAMLSLALDRDDAAWREAVRTDSLCWPQVNMCEEPASATSVNVRYGVSLYPTQMLISPDGQILVRQNGFRPDHDAIAARLEELFGQP